ncbi:CHC2 zinc finger domain-containing protein [Dokdonella ginsengisoli]|uniref:CHC2 zinc finger domain-containing protein n=1 Tax=Dokdonella ginsengisoli TaxID=363846 RepID=A0ABV9R380_9GAMM
MNTPQKRFGPGSGSTLPEATNHIDRIRNSSALDGYRALCGDEPRASHNNEHATRSLPKSWRDRLLHPSVYYRAHIAGLSKPSASGWAVGPCPFHADTNSSLSVQLTETRGGFRCSHCGVGGDLIGFEMRRLGQSFAEAVIRLVRGCA